MIILQGTEFYVGRIGGIFSCNTLNIAFYSLFAYMASEKSDVIFVFAPL